MIVLWLVASAWALDLDEARALAERQALEVQAAEARADAAGADAWASTGASLPSVTAFFDYSLGAGQTAIGFERPIADQYALGLRGAWTVLDPAQWAAATAARRTARGERAVLDWARLTARTEATAAYAEVLAASEVVEAWERSLDDARRQVEAVRSLVSSGLRPPVDEARAVAARDRIRARFVTAEGDLEARCAALQGLLELGITGSCDLEPVQWTVPDAAPPEHPALVASREALAAARTRGAAAGLAFAPTVGVSAQGAQYVVEGSATGYGWSVGLEADLPLVIGTTRFARLASAQARAREAEAGLGAQERDLEVARIAAEARVQAARASIEALEAALRSAEEALRLTDERYRAGLEGISAWLDARQARDAAAVELAQGRAELGRAIADLEAARGG